jgi:hypothetical protein
MQILRVAANILEKKKTLTADRGIVLQLEG